MAIGAESSKDILSRRKSEIKLEHYIEHQNIPLFEVIYLYCSIVK